MMIPAARLGLVFYGGLAMAGLGFAFVLIPAQDADPYFVPLIRQATFQRRGAPTILIDEAHWNTHRLDGRFMPLGRLARADGFRVAANVRSFSAAGLTGARVLITGNPLGWSGMAQQLLNVAGLEAAADIAGDAFTTAEVQAVSEWVRNGGGLLLTADHAPCGRTAQLLAAQFGVRMSNGYTEDRRFHDTVSDSASFLVFSRANGLLGEHPATDGRGLIERVNRVMTFTGQTLDGPLGSVAFLKLSPHAVDYPRRSSKEREGRGAGGRAQGIALHYGKGRVVVLGETAMVTAQRARAGGQELQFGMNRSGNDNQQLVLNILHWLAGVDER
ncbi:MAG: hypothetical protein HY820_35990 [Acidobacteria bacterium]|nr:hypothetical protein [Acidobacteriota bacterium]